LLWKLLLLATWILVMPVYTNTLHLLKYFLSIPENIHIPYLVHQRKVIPSIEQCPKLVFKFLHFNLYL
jgi:hypothetical protein